MASLSSMSHPAHFFLYFFRLTIKEPMIFIDIPVKCIQNELFAFLSER